VLRCPITFKEFTSHSKIVCIKTTGNVYSYEAVEELNIKPKHWKDLLTDEPFTKKDIITIQDPHNLTARDIQQFDFVKKVSLY
jgi:peptidyl-prolyl cis-trans isomerase-like protein 2